MGSLPGFLAVWMVLSLVVWGGAVAAERWLGAWLSPSVRKWGWFFLVLRMAVPLGLGLPLVLAVVPSAPVPGGGTSELAVPLAGGAPLPAPETPLLSAEFEVPVATSDVSMQASVRGDSLFLPGVVGLVWFLGFCFCLTRGLGARQRFRRLARTAQRPSDRVLTLFGQVKARLGIRRGPGPLVLEGLASPVLVGLVRPRLFLPAEDRYTDAELTWMADHELRHWSAGDLWLVGVLQGLTAVLWFVPGLWLAAPRLVAALEADCDRRVLQGRGAEGLRSYSLTLWKVLEAGQGGHPVGMAMAPSARQLRDRFLSLGRPIRRSLPALVLAAGLVAVCSLWGLDPSPTASSADPSVPRLSATAPALSLPVRFGKAFPLPSDAVGALTTAFGPACHPFSGEWYQHEGVDLATLSGTPVMALWAGTVVRQEFEADGLGHFVDVDHGDGVVTRYAHLRDAGKPVGTKVGAGQVIGRVGASGLATGPHLHLGLIVRGQAVDPSPFLEVPSGYPVATADLESSAGPGSSGAPGPGSPLAPTVKFWVTLGFGPARNPFTQKPFFHPGLDLAYRAGTPVLAPWPGTVKAVGDNPEVEGYFVRLDHGNGWESLLSHFQSLPKLQVGDRVISGQTVGLLGTTGQSTGPHLHWELSRNGRPVDPSPFLAATRMAEGPPASTGTPPPGRPLETTVEFRVTQGFGAAIPDDALVASLSEPEIQHLPVLSWGM